MKQNIYDHPTFFKGYLELRDSGITYNDYLEQPAMKAEIPELKGKRVLDLGCGTGVLSSYCVEKGCTSVDAVDISSKMIQRAEERNPHTKINYICTPIEEFEGRDNAYDVIVSSLAIHYIADYETLMKGLADWLKEDGKLIFSIEHPVVTARQEMNNWGKDENGERLHWALDDYHKEGRREQHWFVDGVIKYHRTISTLINGLTAAGFMVEKIVEPLPDQEGLEHLPNLVNEYRRPSFMIIRSRKINQNQV